eukprot:Clim_evm108s149 gene=Clim_evmTU108s149
MRIRTIAPLFVRPAALKQYGARHATLAIPALARMTGARERHELSGGNDGTQPDFKRRKLTKAEKKVYEKNRRQQKRMEAEAKGDHQNSRSKKRAHKAFAAQEPKPEYEFRDGLRHVKPYMYTYRTFAKQRWLGRMLRDVFSDEFRAQEPGFYENQIQLGKLTINGERTSLDYKFKDRDLMENETHRHERPVIDAKLEVQEIDQNVLLVNKPASLPIHATGKYKHNTLLGILEHENGLKNIRTVHRLDRLTSGLMVLARNLPTAQMLTARIRERDVEKTYLALVDGDFPEPSGGDYIIVEKPLKMIAPGLGLIHVADEKELWNARDDGSGNLNIPRSACTKFRKIRFDGKQTLVECLPLTGRMHQIRVHLQYLGFPIVGDPLYNNKEIWGQHMAKGCMEADQLTGVCELAPRLLPAEESRYFRDADELTRMIEEGTADPDCPECKRPYGDPKQSELYICLHALRYKGLDFDYNVDPPSWALPFLK